MLATGDVTVTVRFARPFLIDNFIRAIRLPCANSSDHACSSILGSSFGPFGAALLRLRAHAFLCRSPLSDLVAVTRISGVALRIDHP